LVIGDWPALSKHLARRRGDWSLERRTKRATGFSRGILSDFTPPRRVIQHSPGPKAAPCLSAIVRGTVGRRRKSTSNPADAGSIPGRRL